MGNFKFRATAVHTGSVKSFSAVGRDTGGRFTKGKQTWMARGAGGRFTGLSAESLALKLDIQIRIDSQLESQLRQVAESMKKNAVFSLKGAAYELMQYAKASIVTTRRSGMRGGTPSAPGRPPHTRGIPKKSLRAAIVYEVDKERQTAFIGPRGSMIAEAGMYHEFGGKRGKATYPARPFMQPALRRVAPKLPSKFRNALSGPGT